MKREEIITLKDQGISNRAIAKELGISEGCVRYHIKKLRSDDKCVDNVTQCVDNVTQFTTTINMEELEKQLDIIFNYPANNSTDEQYNKAVTAYMTIQEMFGGYIDGVYKGKAKK